MSGLIYFMLIFMVLEWATIMYLGTKAKQFKNLLDASKLSEEALRQSLHAFHKQSSDAEHTWQKKYEVLLEVLKRKEAEEKIKKVQQP